MADDLRTTELRDLLGRVAARDRAAREELVRRTAGNLERLTRKLMAGYPTVRRWEETADVVQNATLRLLRALEHVSPDDPRQFFGLAAEQIRRELIDLARHYYGPHGVGPNHDTAGRLAPGRGRPRADAGSLADWQAFHEAVAALSDSDREFRPALLPGPEPGRGGRGAGPDGGGDPAAVAAGPVAAARQAQTAARPGLSRPPDGPCPTRR